FSRVPKIEIGVLGEAGLIQAELHEREIVLRRADGDASTIAVDDPAAGRVAVHGGSDLLQMEDFVATVARGGQPRVTLQDSVTSPAVPPNSSITIAMWVRRRCISASSASAPMLSGTVSAGRISLATASERGGAAPPRSASHPKRSLVWSTPMTLSIVWR